MTAASNEVVAVIQADRDMVQAFHRLRLNKLMEAIKDEKAGARLGEDEGDAGDLVQAFALHRIAHSDPRPVAEGLREALEWYGEQARLARLIHSEGDAGRHALAADGGKRASAALATHSPAPMAGADEWVRLAFVTGFEQAKHNDSLTAEQFYDEWAHAGFPAAAHPSTQEGADRG